MLALVQLIESVNILLQSLHLYIIVNLSLRFDKMDCMRWLIVSKLALP